MQRDHHADYRDDYSVCPGGDHGDGGEHTGLLPFHSDRRRWDRGSD
jgi:hypothetical protein